MSEDTPQDDLIGKVLGQYQIEQEVGRGGMATVYRARQQSMNRTVAVKVLPRNLLHDPTFYERFEREVDVIAHLEHPHILPIYDYGQAEGVPYIIMRFLGGGSLEQQIRRGLPDLNDLQKPMRQIAQALDYAHQQGIIHRDLKPGNIMLDEAGNAYLSDFGIARVLGSDLTGSMIIGTPAYMSPEQANGLAIDARSDIYALGIVMFELITGKEPYQAETPMAVLLKHINEPVPPIRSFREDVPEAVELVINKATAKDPDNRFSSAEKWQRLTSRPYAVKRPIPSRMSPHRPSLLRLLHRRQSWRRKPRRVQSKRQQAPSQAWARTPTCTRLASGSQKRTFDRYTHHDSTGHGDCRWRWDFGHRPDPTGLIQPRPDYQQSPADDSDALPACRYH